VAAKVAVTDLLEVIFKVQVPVPLQPPPDQPLNVEPDVGEAAKLTVEPAEYFFAQVTGQAIPPPVTVPDPVPASVTVKPCLAVHVPYLRRAVTLRPSLVWAVIRRMIVPAGSLVSFTGRGGWDSLMVLKCRPLTDTVTVRHLTCGRLRSRNVSVCALTQTLVEGRLNANAGEMCFGWPARSAADARAVVTARAATVTAHNRTKRLN
jgi:hypothetical protein